MDKISAHAAHTNLHYYMYEPQWFIAVSWWQFSAIKTKNYNENANVPERANPPRKCIP